jgi:hypothetical protein
MARGLRFHRLVDFLYTQNPFYLLSACLVLYGLQMAFGPNEQGWIDPWPLMRALCGYAALLAGTAVLIVRLGKVWEDARSILFILLVFFLAISISFDELINTEGNNAGRLLTWGFCFAAAVSELVIRGLRIRLPLLFRIPYYLILAHFYFYPLWIAPKAVTAVAPESLAWRVFLFGTLAAVVFLSLLPAIRRGQGYVRRNGTPWEWPWFPWAVFGTLAVGVCVRSYLLSLWFDTYRGIETVFAPYYIIPFLGVVFVLLLEVGLVERKPAVVRFVIAAVPVLLILALPLGNGLKTTARFSQTFVETIGSPMWLTLVGLCCFYGYAWCRRVRQAEAGFATTVALTSVIGPQTLGLDTLQSPLVWPLLMVGGIELLLSAARQSSLRSLVGMFCLTAALAISMWDPYYLVARRVIPYHVAMLSILLIGSIFQDRLALVLRVTAAALLTATCLSTFVSLPVFEWVTVPFSEWLRVGYVAALAGLALWYWHVTKESWFFVAGAICTFGDSVALSLTTYGSLHRTLGPKGFAPLLWGTLFFLIAAWISARKAGLTARLKDRVSSLEPPWGSSE